MTALDSKRANAASDKKEANLEFQFKVELRDRLHSWGGIGQDRHMKILKIAGGLLIAVGLVVFSLARIAFEIIGASTAPDDFVLLKQRMPRVLEWLFTTPWIVPTLIMVGATALSTWLLWSGIKGAALEPGGDASSLVTMADVEEAIAWRENQQKLTDDQELNAELGRIATDLVALTGQIANVQIAAKSSAKDVGDVLGLRIQQLNDRMDSMATGCAELESTVKGLPIKIDALMERQRERVDGALDGVNQAFRAILNREWHLRLFRELEEAFELLAVPVEQGSGIPDAKVWRDDAKSWRGKLDQWLIIANYYAMGTAENVLSIPEHLYEGDWRFDETKLTANQVHRWKELAIWWHNAKEAKARVDSLIENAAFNLPTQKRRLDAPPRID